MDRAVMPWRRIALEGFVIVVSILLAFAIDAWWEGRKEQARLHALVQALVTDFEITRERLASSIERGDALVARTVGFLSLKGSHEVPPLDSVRFLGEVR